MNKAKSVLARLLKLSQKRRVDYNYILSRYGIERLLCRFVHTSHADRFILKGAMLFLLWHEDSYRPTKDLDVLGLDQVDERDLFNIFREICLVEIPDDGIRFDPDSVLVEEIREGELYHGYRVKISAFLGTAKISIQVDVGLGDTLFPEPGEEEFPSLLDNHGPRVKVYPKEAVVAEKFDAIIAFGLRNSRMKDYFDIYMLAKDFDFEGGVLSKAIISTVIRRGRTIPISIPDGLTEEFFKDSEKKKQWDAFIGRSVPHYSKLSIKKVTTFLRSFFEPIIQSYALDVEFDATWLAGGPWNERE